MDTVLYICECGEVMRDLAGFDDMRHRHSSPPLRSEFLAALVMAPSVGHTIELPYVVATSGRYEVVVDDGRDVDVDMTDAVWMA